MKKIETHAAVFKALGHPVRLKMVSYLLQADTCNVNKMVDLLKIPQPTVSQQLSILKNSGIIDCRKQGVKTCYRVVNDKVRQLLAVLQKN